MPASGLSAAGRPNGHGTDGSAGSYPGIRCLGQRLCPWLTGGICGCLKGNAVQATRFVIDGVVWPAAVLLTTQPVMEYLVVLRATCAVRQAFVEACLVPPVRVGFGAGDGLSSENGACHERDHGE
jgi:hypothetical protein